MERDLVERAQRGDEHAFAELAFAIGDRLFAVAYRILRDSDLADDAVQQSLVSIWRELPALRDRDRFGAWSYRLLVNACYREARRARRWQANLQLVDPPDPGGDPQLSVADRDQLERAFRRLKPEQRAAVVLQYYLGMSLDEVAETLGIPVGTARSRIHYAKQSLRAALEADARPAAEGRQA